MFRSRSLVLGTAALAVVLFVPRPVLAHDLRVKVDTRQDPVRVEAWYESGFGDSDPAEAAKATVTDADGNEVASGVLDAKGVWTFPRPGPGQYTVVVEAAGHRDSVSFEQAGEYAGWRLDKRLGLALGLVVLLGGSVLFWYARRHRFSPPVSG
ncbi:MAG TPA: carboxypeptidase-like regulatory domain-containing protein [Gemmataceae bacterium]|nr:carboxypeptidase-like regulatory domain-containing protein [Gemmataceae bacterium]